MNNMDLITTIGPPHFPLSSPLSAVWQKAFTTDLIKLNLNPNTTGTVRPTIPSYSYGEFKQRRSEEMGVLGQQSRISITVLVVVLLVPGDWGRITIRGEIWYWLSKLVQSLHLVVVLQCEGLRTPPSPAESQLPLSVQSLSSTDLGGPARSHYPYISWLGENLSRWWETWGGGCHWAFHSSNDNYLIILRSIEALIWMLASSDEISFGS